MSQDTTTTIPVASEPNLPVRPAKPAKTGLGARLVEKIRSELNIEKWPSLWQPAKSKNAPTVRVMQREISADDGSRMVSRVEVGYTQLGTLTTEEQKLLYVLIKLWEDAGKPDVQVFFSTRALARLLRKKGWGSNVIEAITKSLRKLRTIPIEMINSYYDKTETGSVLVDKRPFTILGDLRIVERQVDGAVNSSLGYFKFDDHILSNLQRNYTKPVCIEEFFKLKSEIAQLVYSHVDLILSDKTKYERRTKELFDDLGLRNAEYQHMYGRKRALEPALQELQEIRLSTGVLKAAQLEKTADGKDYKVVFSKVASARPLLAADQDPAREPAVIVNNYSKPKDPLALQAEDLVKYFHQVFHGVESHQPQSKETAQALTLVSQYGPEEARAVVDFAHEQAAETKFNVQHFGAVLTYASRALAARTKKTVTMEATRPAAQLARAATKEPETYPIGERRFQELTGEDRQNKLARAKDQLFRDQPFLARTFKPDSAMHQRAIRARAVRDLETEPMDLMIVPEWLVALRNQIPPTQNLPR